MRKLLFSLATTALALGLFVAPALAANGHSLFGEAEYVSPGNGSNRAVKTVSDADPGYGGIDFAVPEGTTFADLQTLSTDYNVTDDDCTNGSPRFQISVTNGVDTGNIFAYLGAAPNYTNCPQNTWVNSGDLLEGVNPIDTTQLDNGAFYDPYATALTKYGGYEVTGIQLVTDAGYAFPDGEQTVLFDNTLINSMLHTYELNTPTSKDQCKNGGYKDLVDQNGQPFKNQGQCVSYFNHNR